MIAQAAYYTSAQTAGTGRLGGSDRQVRREIGAEKSAIETSHYRIRQRYVQHIAGTLAPSDNLGVPGAQGPFTANIWRLVIHELTDFRAFRDFNGTNHKFGKAPLQAASTIVSNVTI
jgi:hypothetical protein